MITSGKKHGFVVFLSVTPVPFWRCFLSRAPRAVRKLRLNITDLLFQTSPANPLFGMEDVKGDLGFFVQADVL